MAKAFKELKDGDIVYVVETWPNMDMHSVIECKIRLKFKDFTLPNDIYIRHKYEGYLDSGKKKFWHGYSGQVIRISTIYRKDGHPMPKKEFYDRSETSAVMKEDFIKYTETSHCVYQHDMHIFTDLEEAKEFIVDNKLKDIKNELLKTVKCIKYKPEN